jgi:hypothetical protein
MGASLEETSERSPVPKLGPMAHALHKRSLSAGVLALINGHVTHTQQGVRDLLTVPVAEFMSQTRAHFEVAACFSPVPA